MLAKVLFIPICYYPCSLPSLSQLSPLSPLVRFNPSVGILDGHTRPGPGGQASGGRFNPSVGILGGHTPHESEQPLPQFASFNPSVGILGGHTRAARAKAAGPRPPFQSLSRDSWWSHMKVNSTTTPSIRSFNPSVGILGGHTIAAKLESRH